MSNQPYDPTTPIGQVRFHVADTDNAAILTETCVFSDTELQLCLTIANNNPQRAAAKALRAAAADEAKIAAIVRMGDMWNDEHLVSDKLLATASELEAKAFVSPVVNSPKQAFRPHYEGSNDPGNMRPW